MGCAGRPNATPNSTGLGPDHWRETGAKEGDFPLQTYDGLPERTICYRDFNHLAVAASLAKAGVAGSNPIARSNICRGLGSR
jgi:hypothetical protein